MKKTHQQLQRNYGFTLVEVMVAVSIFTIVMAVGLGALLTTNQAYRRAQSQRTVIDNLGFALEAMTRQMRIGTTYHCADALQLPTPAGLAVPKSCLSGADAIAFEPVNGDPADPGNQVVYRWQIDGTTGRGRIERSNDAGGSWVAVTSSDIDVQDFVVRVIGAENVNDDTQPFAIITLRGEYTVSRQTSDFVIQTSVTPRVIDFRQ